jgi:hypothetical protein
MVNKVMLVRVIRYEKANSKTLQSNRVGLPGRDGLPGAPGPKGEPMRIEVRLISFSILLVAHLHRFRHSLCRVPVANAVIRVFQALLVCQDLLASLV